MKIVRWSLGMVLFVSIATAVLWWWNSQSIKVDVASVARGKLLETLIVDGVTSARDRTTIVAPISGMLRRIKLESGDSVEKDMLLAVIDPPPPALLDKRTREVALAKENSARTEWNRAITGRDNAESNLKQVQKKKAPITAPQGQPRPVAPDLELEEQTRKRELEAAERIEERARMDLNGMLAQLGMAQELAKKKTEESKATDSKATDSKEPTKEKGNEHPESKEVMELHSPSQGQVLKVLNRDGGIIVAGTPLLEIGNLHRIEFGFDVHTTEASRIKMGTSVQLRGWSSDGGSFRGRVTKIESSAVRRLSPLGVEEFRTRVTVAPVEGEIIPTSLGDGYKIEGIFQLYESPEVIKVPLGAIFRKDGDWFVFRAVNGRAIQTKVELGLRNDRESVVVSGLSDYDLVVLFPANRIENAAKISIR